MRRPAVTATGIIFPYHVSREECSRARSENWKCSWGKREQSRAYLPYTCTRYRTSFIVGYDSAQYRPSHLSQRTSSSPLHLTRLPLGYVRLPPRSVCTPLHVARWSKISLHKIRKGTINRERKLTIPLFRKSKSIPSKKFSPVVADTGRFSSPMFTWVSDGTSHQGSEI